VSPPKWCVFLAPAAPPFISPRPGVVSAPLWNSEQSKFAGMLTVLDIIHLIQYYYRTASYDYAFENVETFRLESLRGLFPSPFFITHHLKSLLDIEIELGVAQPPLHREHPSSSLYDAAKLLIQTHARRLPLLDNDSETGHEVIVSVLTQYRLLKFISINVRIPSSSPLSPISLSPSFSVTRKYSSFTFPFEN